MSEPTSPRSGDIIGRCYQIDSVLGEGGMGTVYLARHTVTGRRVALKWMRASDEVQRQRMLREARSMGKVAHPNVVGVLDAGEHGGAVFMVMEYVGGQNLRTHVAGQQLPPDVAIDLLMPAMAGVAAAHQAGILHRDLKPENLFVCTDGDGTAFDTKVLDFGVAKSLDDGEVSLTSTGTLVGTPKYMAPEQVLNGDDLDVRMDVYTLALILYELLAGKLPYKTVNLKQLVVEILAGKLVPLAVQRPDLPPELCEVITKALALEREERHADVATLARALEPFAGARRFVPPRMAHTPKPTMQEIMSPELRAAALHGAATRRIAAVPEVVTQAAVAAPGAAKPSLPPGIDAIGSKLPRFSETSLEALRPSDASNRARRRLISWRVFAFVGTLLLALLLDYLFGH